MKFEEFKVSPEFLKMKAVYRLTGRLMSDLDLYLAYILKEKIEFDIEHIKQLLKNKEISSILLYQRRSGGNHIEFKDWGTALKHPEYSIFVTSMQYLFYSCPDKSLDLSKFNTINVRDMSGMFTSCHNLMSLDLSSFDTSKVEYIQRMFFFCESLTSINLSSFNTANVKDMSSMFGDCKSLKNLELSNFNTSKVTIMRDMFCNCESLTGLDLSSFNTANVRDMSMMFGECRSLKSLDLTNFNTDEVIDMEHMFLHCTNLVSLNLSNFNTYKIIHSRRSSMEGMFNYCESLKNLITDDEKIREEFRRLKRERDDI